MEYLSENNLLSAQTKKLTKHYACLSVRRSLWWTLLYIFWPVRSIRTVVRSFSSPFFLQYNGWKKHYKYKDKTNLKKKKNSTELPKKHTLILCLNKLSFIIFSIFCWPLYCDHSNYCDHCWLVILPLLHFHHFFTYNCSVFANYVQNLVQDILNTTVLIILILYLFQTKFYKIIVYNLS